MVSYSTMPTKPTKAHTGGLFYLREWPYAIPDEYDEAHDSRWRKIKAEAEKFLREMTNGDTKKPK